jgi:hypothetical protein
MKTKFLFAAVGLMVGIFYYFGSMLAGLANFSCSESHSSGVCSASKVLDVLFYPVQAFYNAVGNNLGITAIAILLLFTVLGLIIGVAFDRKVESGQ